MPKIIRITKQSEDSVISVSGLPYFVYMVVYSNAVSLFYVMSKRGARQLAESAGITI